jgi:hypothetical protein
MARHRRRVRPARLITGVTVTIACLVFLYIYPQKLNYFAGIATIGAFVLALGQRIPGKRPGKHVRRAHRLGPPMSPGSASDYAQAQYEDGRHDLERQQTAAALEKFKIATVFGHGDAAFQAGRLLAQASQEDAEYLIHALAYLIHAAKRGHPLAYDLLGVMCRQRLDIERLMRINEIFASELHIPRLTTGVQSRWLGEVEADLRLLAAAGYPGALNWLAVLLCRSGRTAEADELLGVGRPARHRGGGRRRHRGRARR